MTSPSTYTSVLRVNTGNTSSKHLSENDVTVTSSRNSLSVISSPRSAGQGQATIYLRTPGISDDSPGLIRRRTVLTSGEYNCNNNNHHQQQQQRVVKATSRAVSVPANHHHHDLETSSDLECSRSSYEGEGHQRHRSSGVINLTLVQPTGEFYWLKSKSDRGELTSLVSPPWLCTDP